VFRCPSAVADDDDEGSQEAEGDEQPRADRPAKNDTAAVTGPKKNETAVDPFPAATKPLCLKDLPLGFGGGECPMQL
jgi:hypothetical protein